MKIKRTFLAAICWAFIINYSSAQEGEYAITLQVSIDEAIKNNIKPDGRLLIFLSKDSRREPRSQLWPSNGNYIFAKNINGIDPNSSFDVSSSGLMSTADWTLDKVPEDTYYVQVVWDQDKKESRIDAPGNAYSKVEKLDVTKEIEVDIWLSEIIGPRKILEHKYVKEVALESKLLSKFWDRISLSGMCKVTE